MRIELLKEKLHSLINKTNNEAFLLLKAKSRKEPAEPHVSEGLSKDDYDELVSLINEPPEKDTISYDELKASLSRWFAA